MRQTLLLLVGASLASTAVAQTKSDSQLRAQSQMRSSEYDPGAPRYAASPDEIQCLVRKRDYIRVCHTHERWRAIAMRIEREDARKR